MATVTIKGMRCQHCVASVKKALEEIPGVSNVTVELEKNRAGYEGDPGADVVAEAIAKIGFEVVS